MEYKIVVSDDSVAGLEYKRDLFNADQSSNLTTAEYIGLTLDGWARHAVTKKRKEIAQVLAQAFLSASPDEQQKMLEQANEFLNKPRGVVPVDRGAGI